jgi:3-hydroxymyristoyl/3-hydroxydecanoyl-(acyl carrier protein) dehydratase
MTRERTVAISREHPALPGHFPGRPIVPGVVVLDEVIETLKEEYGQGLLVTGLPAVKLSSPLLPEEELTIKVDREDAETIAFTCRVGDRLVASGSIRAILPDAR